MYFEYVSVWVKSLSLQRKNRVNFVENSTATKTFMNKFIVVVNKMTNPRGKMYVALFVVIK